MIDITFNLKFEWIYESSILYSVQLSSFYTVFNFLISTRYGTQTHTSTSNHDLLRSQSNKIKYMILILLVQILSLPPIIDLPCIYIFLINLFTFWQLIKLAPRCLESMLCSFHWPDMTYHALIWCKQPNIYSNQIWFGFSKLCHPFIHVWSCNERTFLKWFEGVIITVLWVNQHHPLHACH